MVHQRWIIIISTCIVEVEVMGLCSAFPVLFSTLLEKFSESRARTATTPSIIFGVAGCSGIINGLLVQRIGPSKSGFVAGMLMGIGWMVCFFSSSILYLDLLLAVPMGIGTSVLLLSANKILSHHFTGNAGIITLSVQSTVSGVGRIIFTYILSASNETFGLQGSFLIMGAVLLNCSILSILWQTIQSHERSISTKLSVLSAKSGTTCGKKCFWFQCGSVFTNNIFMIFCIGTALHYVPHGGVLIVLTDIMKSQGLSEKNIMITYLIHSISNLLGRMSFSLLKQVPRISILSIVLLLSCMSIISFSTVHLANDFRSAAVACFFLGFEFGAAAPAIPIGTLNILGPEHMPTGMGFVFSVAGVGNVVVGPITENVWTRWSLDPDLANSTNTSVIIWNKSFSSKTLCFFECTYDNECMSVFYHPQRRACMGSSSHKQGLPEEKKGDSGWDYYTCTLLIRLVGGRNNHEGRVEVYYKNAWGTVCDDFWDTNDAKVVCRMLGHSTAGAVATSLASFGENTNLEIFLDDVNCLGNESSIHTCVHGRWKEHNCRHFEDAGVQCAV